MTATLEGYSSSEVCRFTGVSYRQLDHWCRRGYIEPSIEECRGSGSQRRWSELDLIVVSVLGRFSGAGHHRFGLVASALGRLRESGELARAAWLVVGANGALAVAAEDWELSGLVAGFGGSQAVIKLEVPA